MEGQQPCGSLADPAALLGAITCTQVTGKVVGENSGKAKSENHRILEIDTHAINSGWQRLKGSSSHQVRKFKSKGCPGGTVG